jgi:ankyrin repeat protein
VEGARRLLGSHPELKSRLSDPIGPFDSPALNSARSRSMVDLLLAEGADINAKSQWWAGAFGFLHIAPPELAEYGIERGAAIDVHAAARVGRPERLRELIEEDPTRVHARGGDGQTPLHFASTVGIAAYLLEKGADINALDIDHESTPAQWMLGDRLGVARYLVERGCVTDILLAAATGDLEAVRKHLDADPDAIHIRANAECFPMANPKAGGKIYFWTLGSNASVYQAAAKSGNAEVVRLLLERSSSAAKLIAACWLHDADLVASLKTQDPDLPQRLSDLDRGEIARAAHDNDTQAVLLMLEAGLPASAPGPDRGTPLHWAAWHGNLALVEALLRFRPNLEDNDNVYRAKPIGWASHGSENGWHRRTGNYAGVVEALLQAGAELPPSLSGSDAVKEVLRRHGAK